MKTSVGVALVALVVAACGFDRQYNDQNYAYNQNPNQQNQPYGQDPSVPTNYRPVTKPHATIKVNAKERTFSADENTTCRLEKLTDSVYLGVTFQATDASLKLSLANLPTNRLYTKWDASENKNRSIVLVTNTRARNETYSNSNTARDTSSCWVWYELDDKLLRGQFECTDVVDAAGKKQGVGSGEFACYLQTFSNR